ncbi:MAG: peptidase M23 [Salinivirgaceae bacterium]|nr:MAG: peptidase M23 [Salinivirgaceae bacterium]
MAKQKKKKKVISRLRRRYRLVIMNDQTFEERWSYRLTGLNVLTAFSALAMILIFIGITLISFTPLKQLLPEYPDAEFHEQMIYNAVRLDSVERELALRDQYIRNLKHILMGDTRTRVEDVPDTQELYSNLNVKPSKEDSLLRKRVELDQQASILGEKMNRSKDNIKELHFYPPVKGLISNKFNFAEGHFGIDLVTEKSSAVHATLSGTVISSSWSIETGYTIQIQHTNNLISVYKHNESLIKEQGDLVTTGEAIAFVGNTGEFTTGPHLHFELWHNGSPVDPEIFIKFE